MPDMPKREAFAMLGVVSLEMPRREVLDTLGAPESEAFAMMFLVLSCTLKRKAFDTLGAPER